MTEANYHSAENGIDVPQATEPISEPWTCQYVLSILVNIFCFAFPGATIGTMHLLAARADAVSGYTFLAQKKKKQALTWTVPAFVLGCIILLLYIVIIAAGIVSIS